MGSVSFGANATSFELSYGWWLKACSIVTARLLDYSHMLMRATQVQVLTNRL